MEQNTQNTMQEGGDKSNGGWKIATVVASIIAVVGLGVGIYGIMGAKDKADDLKVVVENTDGTVTEIETPKIESTKNDGTVITITDSAITAENPEDYIYVGEWGLKFKIPENLEMVSYFVRNWDEDNYAGTSLCVTGATTGHDGSPSFVKNMIEDSLHVCLDKNTKSLSEDEGGVLYQTIPAGEYYFTGPQAIFGDGSDADWEVESVNVIKAMLNDNRSSI